MLGLRTILPLHNVPGDLSSLLWFPSIYLRLICGLWWSSQIRLFVLVGLFCWKLWHTSLFPLHRMLRDAFIKNLCTCDLCSLNLRLTLFSTPSYIVYSNYSVEGDALRWRWFLEKNCDVIDLWIKYSGRPFARWHGETEEKDDWVPDPKIFLPFMRT